MGLSGHCNLTNMMMFDPNRELGGSKIRKFLRVAEIMKRFYTIRYEFYGKRKEFMVNKLKKELKMLENRVRFIRAVINGELEIRDRPKADILHQLERDGYDLFSKEIEEEEEEEEEFNLRKLSTGYNYLLSMPLWSLTKEKIEKLEAERNVKKEELDILVATSLEDLWITDLDLFLTELNKFEKEKEKERNDDEKLRRQHSRKKKKKKKKKMKREKKKKKKKKKKK